MGRLYTVTFENVAITAIQDLFEVVPSSTKKIRIHRCEVFQTSDVGDAAEEILRVRWIRGYTTSGSGGNSFTPAPVDPGDSAFGGTAEINNTTVASAGTPIVMGIGPWNVRSSYLYYPTPEQRFECEAGSRIVLHLPAAPTDSLSSSGELLFEEL